MYLRVHRLARCQLSGSLKVGRLEAPRRVALRSHAAARMPSETPSTSWVPKRCQLVEASLFGGSSRAEGAERGSGGPRRRGSRGTRRPLGRWDLRGCRESPEGRAASEEAANRSSGRGSGRGERCKSFRALRAGCPIDEPRAGCVMRARWPPERSLAL
jgi:hypothetical protein